MKKKIKALKKQHQKELETLRNQMIKIADSRNIALENNLALLSRNQKLTSIVKQYKLTHFSLLNI